jgi:hypothetical protein
LTAELIEIDSRVLGGNVLAIHDFDPLKDFRAFEAAYETEHRPCYVSCKVPLEKIHEVHTLEDAGFRLIECQIRSAIKLRKCFDVSGFAYEFRRVATEEELGPVLEIAGTTFTHDRFSVDTQLGPVLAGARYRQYVKRSFHAPDEAVYRLVDAAGGATVAFKTHRRLGGTEALLLLGGVHPDYKNLGLGVVNEYFEFNELISRGVRRAVTHISAANHAVFNLEIGSLGFRVIETFAVMRKIYNPRHPLQRRGL